MSRVIDLRAVKITAAQYKFRASLMMRVVDAMEGLGLGFVGVNYAVGFPDAVSIEMGGVWMEEIPSILTKLTEQFGTLEHLGFEICEDAEECSEHLAARYIFLPLVGMRGDSCIEIVFYIKDDIKDAMSRYCLRRVRERGGVDMNGIFTRDDDCTECSWYGAADE